MMKKLISDLKVGDELYRISHSTGKLLTYKIYRIDGSWFYFSNETGNPCASMQCTDASKDNINRIYYTHPLFAMLAALKKIRDEQYKLEQERKRIIKANNIKVKINDYHSKGNLFTRVISNIKGFFNNN